MAKKPNSPTTKKDQELDNYDLRMGASGGDMDSSPATEAELDKIKQLIEKRKLENKKPTKQGFIKNSKGGLTFP